MSGVCGGDDSLAEWVLVGIAQSNREDAGESNFVVGLWILHGLHFLFIYL